MRLCIKIASLALCLVLLAVPLFMTAPEAAAASVYDSDLYWIRLKDEYTYSSSFRIETDSNSFMITANDVYCKNLIVDPYYLQVFGNMKSTNIYVFSHGWVDEDYRYLKQVLCSHSSLSSAEKSNLAYLLDGYVDVQPVDVYVGAEALSRIYLETSETTCTIFVDSAGFTLTDSNGSSIRYDYSETADLLGVSLSDDLTVEYAVGSSYTVNFNPADVKNLYLIDSTMLDYDLSVYGLSGETVIDNVSSADPIEMTVTSTGATFRLTDQTLSYTYTGTEIFAGFATSASGAATYKPGNTYTLDASSTSLYAKETVRPTYTASFYDISGTLSGSTGTSYSPLTLQVTNTGATITLADGEPLSYTYTGSEIFAGFATSASGAATYKPGNTYTLDVSSTSLYAKETARPTYAASIYDVSGTLSGSTGRSYSPLTLKVTSSGATIIVPDGSPLVYTYTGTEIFAGFATSASGSVVYSPGETYTLSSASVKLYAKEAARPTYTVTLYDVGNSAALASATSYEYITLKVTASGAVFTSQGETFEYVYPGTEIFAGFATTTGGTAEYVPGKTYTLSAASTSLYALETPRPVYTLTLYDTSGTAVVGPVTSYSPISLRITGNSVKVSTDEGTVLTWEYAGDKSFLGFALDQSAEAADYHAGVTYKLQSYDVSLYAVDKVIDLGAAGDVLDVFASLSGFFVNLVVFAIGAFWSAESGLTFLGSLLIITAGILAVFAILFFVILWIKNRR